MNSSSGADFGTLCTGGIIAGWRDFFHGKYQMTAAGFQVEWDLNAPTSSMLCCWCNALRPALGGAQLLFARLAFGLVQPSDAFEHVVSGRVGGIE
jgi:hypothetical protein